MSTQLLTLHAVDVVKTYYFSSSPLLGARPLLSVISTGSSQLQRSPKETWFCRDIPRNYLGHGDETLRNKEREKREEVAGELRSRCDRQRYSRLTPVPSSVGCDPPSIFVVNACQRTCSRNLLSHSAEN